MGDNIKTGQKSGTGWIVWIYLAQDRDRLRALVNDLTLRFLMSHIYIYIYMEHLFLMFLDHTQRRSTVGRTPLDE